MSTYKLKIMRKNTLTAFGLGMATLMYVACSAPDKGAAKVDLEKLKPEIQAMEDAFSAAEKAKDAAAVAAYYSEDAVSYSRNKPPLSGRAAIQAKIAEDLAKDTTGETNVYKVVDLFAEGDLLVEIGSWTSMDAAGAEKDKGHYMSVFRKKDGKYTCIRDMNVSSNPAK